MPQRLLYFFNNFSEFYRFEMMAYTRRILTIPKFVLRFVEETDRENPQHKKQAQHKSERIERDRERLGQKKGTQDTRQKERRSH